MELIVSDFGAFVGKKSERIVVRRKPGHHHSQDEDRTIGQRNTPNTRKGRGDNGEQPGREPAPATTLAAEPITEPADGTLCAEPQTPNPEPATSEPANEQPDGNDRLDEKEMIQAQHASRVRSQQPDGNGQPDQKETERVNEPDQVEEYPLYQVTHLIIGSPGVSLSSDVIRECALAGIPISFLSGSGKPLARLSSPEMTGTAETRRQQMLAFLDERSVRFAQAIARAKITNQRVILKYFAKSRKASQRELYDHIREVVGKIEKIQADLDQPQIAQAERIDDVRAQILSVEGRAANLYWQMVAELLPADVGFPHREHQGAQDLTNTLLNYGYGILYSQVWGAVVLAGLDPFAGFLHVDRPGKPSLVLDLVEEFRQMVVDRVVLALLIKGVRYELNEEHRLTDQARREFAERIIERLDSPVRYEGRHERLRAVIQKQARHLACFFRREREYIGFVGTW